jgi:hypothetical protein
MDYFQSQHHIPDTPTNEAGYLGHGRPPGRANAGTEEDEDVDEDGAHDAQVDMHEYERRMKDVFDAGTPISALSPTASTAASTADPGLGGYSGRRGYDTAYQDILGEKAGGAGEEESETLEFPQRVSGSVRPGKDYQSGS